MKELHIRSGTTLLETILFLGILSIISGTIVGVFIATQDARLRQRSVAELEQQGTLMLSIVTKVIRRAEKVLLPVAGSTGSTLLLQMAQNDEYPTMITKVGSGLVLVQKSETSSLLSSSLIVTDLTFTNVADSNVWLSVGLSVTIPTIAKQTYSRNFTGTATLFPDDQSDAGGCGSCPLPACIEGQYTWYVCTSGICSQSDTTLPC